QVRNGAIMVEGAADEDRKPLGLPVLVDHVAVEIVDAVLVKPSQQIVATERSDRIVEETAAGLLQHLPAPEYICRLRAAQPVDVREDVGAERPLLLLAEGRVRHNLDSIREFFPQPVEILAHRVTVTI